MMMLMIIIIGTLSLAPGLHGGQTIYVDDDAAPGGNGEGWKTAYRFLQDALPEARGLSTIRIAGGQYRPDRSAGEPKGTGNREVAFGIAGGLTLEGGYAGVGAEDPDARDPSFHETVLSGDLLGNDGPGFENMEDNSTTVVRYLEFDEHAFVLDGLTVAASRGAGVGSSEIRLNVRGCRFVGHRGNAVWLGMAYGSIVDTVFAGNGNGEFGTSAVYINPRTFVIDRCRFSDNTAFGGGALTVGGGDQLDVRNCVFERNVSTGVGEQNFAGGGAVVHDYTGASFTNCLFIGNRAASRGGAMFIREIATQITHCTFVGNEAPIASAAFSGAGHFEMSSCIMWGNVGAPIVGDLNVMTWSIVEGGWPGEGNLDVDPQFVDALARDYRLAEGSPAIDASDSTQIPDEVTVDLDGRPRFRDDACTPDTGIPNADGLVADMGAYEFFRPGDANGDCVVDFADVLVVITGWGDCPAPPAPCPGDVNDDGGVDFADLLVVLGNWS